MHRQFIAVWNDDAEKEEDRRGRRDRRQRKRNSSSWKMKGISTTAVIE
jgi:hypothetical protein